MKDLLKKIAKNLVAIGIICAAALGGYYWNDRHIIAACITAEGL